jgi:hypothetical protein
MQIISSPNAKNGSTYIVLADFTDEVDVAVVPNTIQWSLTDINGTIINNRDDVSVTPASSISIVLEGDDILVTDGLERLITIEAVYNSATYGNDLPLVDQAKFTIDEFTNEV